MKIKRTLSAFLAIMFILASFPLTAFATDLDGEGNAGTGTGAGDTNSDSTWHDGKQGYRFVIADQNLQPISNVVDITFSNPELGEWYFNSRLTPLSQDKGSLGYEIKTWDAVLALAEESCQRSKDPTVKIDSPPPAAIGWPGEDPIAQGLAFKDWFMGTEEFLDTPAPPEHSGGGGGDTGRRISGQ